MGTMRSWNNGGQVASLTAVSQLKAAESLLAVQNRKAVNQDRVPVPTRFSPGLITLQWAKFGTPLFVLNVGLNSCFLLLSVVVFQMLLFTRGLCQPDQKEQFSCNAAGICCRVASQAYKPKLEKSDSNCTFLCPFWQLKLNIYEPSSVPLISSSNCSVNSLIEPPKECIPVHPTFFT